MLLQLPENLNGLRARIEIKGPGVHQTMAVSSEIKQIKKSFAEDVDEDSLAVNLQFIDNGGQPVGELIVLQEAADSPPPLDSFQRAADEEVEEMNEAIKVEDQDADKPELLPGETLNELENADEEVALEDCQEESVEANESLPEKTSNVEVKSRRRRRRGK